MTNRVVITGLGVVAPGAANLAAFEQFLRSGTSGITFNPESADCGLACQVAGVPSVDKGRLDSITLQAERRGMNNIMELAALAAVEAWRDSGMPYHPGSELEADPATGVVFGTGIGGIDTLCGTVAPAVFARQVRSLGAKRAEQCMASGSAACVSGLLGAGGPVIATSAACSTGSAALIQALRLIRAGCCDRILAGAAETCNLFTAAIFDALHVLVRDSNDQPTGASRPLSARAAGFVPAGGAGALVLESLQSARARGCRIYAEILGGFENCGGQRSGGSMTRQSPSGAIRCIRGAMVDAQIHPEEVDFINGHLTSTSGDTGEVANLGVALARDAINFPWIQSTKSLIGHTLGAAGAIESVATVLQLHRGFLHPSLNCEDLHPEIARLRGRVPHSLLEVPTRTALKTSFGFGDVNACVIFRGWID